MSRRAVAVVLLIETRFLWTRYKKKPLSLLLKKESGFATDAGPRAEQASSSFREAAFGC
jgi:hypothetical protein